MVEPVIKELLEAGVHFGHQTKRWNPKMKKYIFGERNGIYIVNLEITSSKLGEARDFLKDLGSRGGTIVFVGTKKQAQETIREQAVRCGMFYVTQRWLGGAMTNFQTIRKGIDRLGELNRIKKDSVQLSGYTKKEKAVLEKERGRLEKNLGGLLGLEKQPDCMIVVDSKKEEIAVSEANRLGIPVVALVDTNCDPDQITYVIPGNDDAIKSIRLIITMLTNSIVEGRDQFLLEHPQEADKERKRVAAIMEAEAPPVEAEVAPPVEGEVITPLMEETFPPVEEAVEEVVEELEEKPIVSKIAGVLPKPRPKKAPSRKPKAKEKEKEL